jgi:diguanylate cyclase (GGDEF)-like protein/PAS domain S-box-containing protein
MPYIVSLQHSEELANATLEAEKTTILIVDDESLNRFLTAEALSGDNYHIVEAESGEAAIEYVSHHNVDLILLDIDMPGIGGLAACAAIRALPHGQLVPIAMVTGLDDNVSIERAFDSGATDFFTKPVNWTLMRQRVRFMLRHGNVTRELHRNEQVLEQAQEIAEIGYWQWDAVTHVIYHSAAYCRLLPGLPPRLSDATFDTETASEYGRFVLAEIRRVMLSGDTDFRFECSINIPERGKRRLLYHGTIEYSDGKPVYLISTVQDITQRYQDEERYAAIFDASPVGIVESDSSKLLEITQKPNFAEISDELLRAEITALLAHAQGDLFYIKANPAAQHMFTHDTQDPHLQSLRAEMTFSFLAAIRDNKPEAILQCQLPLKTGEYRNIIINTRLPKTPDEYRRVVISLNDVTDLMKRESQLKRADAIIANSSDAVVIIDKEQKVLAINPAYTKVTGYTLEQLRVMNLADQLSADPNRDRIIASIGETLMERDYWRGEIDFVRADGALMPTLMQINIIRNEQGEFGSVIITTDISHIKESERRLFQLAHFDALTGLPNRLSLQERLQTEFNNAANGGSFCLLYIDLDGFKLVNDSMGHPTGDTILREVSARLSKSCRPGDLLTRIGGDEFALLMVFGATNEEIDAQGDRIFTSLDVPINTKGRDIFIGASIGACRYPEDTSNAEEMLRNADSAMYEAKRRGRGQLCYYSAELTSVSNHRLQVENELRIAISSDQLFLLYQPKYDAMTGAMVGAEALVRWRNPTRGVVPPAEFISIAEASGLIVSLGEWVINEACHQLAEWQRNHGCSIPMAINISALHLREQSLLLVVSGAIARFNIDPKLLEIEITEDSLDFRGEDDKPYTMLNQLSELGVSIAIDDFGTGYSSLSQLKKMPISTLKIDMSFVRDIAASESDHAIITAIVGLAKTLGMQVVAEGVENEEQASQLRILKCDVLQGFLYSKPISADELLRKFLAQRTGN